MKTKTKNKIKLGLKFVPVIIVFFMFLYLLNTVETISKIDAHKSVSQSTNIISSIAIDINTRKPSENDYLAELKNYISSIDSADGTYAQLFNSNGDEMYTRRSADSIGENEKFSVKNNKDFMKTVRRKTHGQFTMDYNGSSSITVVYEWIPCDDSIPRDGQSYLVVVGKIDNTAIVYQNLIVNFILVSSILTIIVVSIASYVKNFSSNNTRKQKDD